MPPRNKKKQTKKNKKRNNNAIVKTNVLANNVSPRPIKARQPRRQATPAVRMHHVRATCSATNPFCPAAKNARWPDGTTGNTHTEQFRGTIGMSGTTNFNQVMCFAAAAPFGIIGPAVSATGSSCTVGALYVVYRLNSMLATYGAKYRIVSFGVIVRCIASATTASGIVTLGTSAPVPNGATVLLGAEQYDECIIKAIQPGMEISWISAPQGPGAHTFIYPSSSSGFSLIPPDWTSLTVEMAGVPSGTPMLMCEWYLNIEFQLAPSNNNNLLAGLSTPNPPKSPVVEQLHSAVHTSVGSFIEGGVASVEKIITEHASAAFDAFVSDPLTSIAALFG